MTAKKTIALDSARVGFTLHRVDRALAGEFDAELLTPEEMQYFEDKFGEAMDGEHTPAAREFWATFKPAPNTDEESMDNVEFGHFLSKARDAVAGGRDAWSVQSTGEKLAVALALNHFDWLQAMNYTIAEAIERVGPEWAGMIPDVAKAIRDESE